MASKHNVGKNHHKFKDLTGSIIGDLTINDYVLIDKRWLWECSCKCGSILYVRSSKFLSDNPQKHCKKCSDTIKAKNAILPNSKGLKNRLYRRYKAGAINRKLSFELSQDIFEQLIKKNCYYCNTEPILYKEDLPYHNAVLMKRNGIDRKDNSEGYTIENSVPCCKMCNIMKMDTPYDVFLDKIIKIKNNLKL